MTEPAAVEHPGAIEGALAGRLDVVDLKRALSRFATGVTVLTTAGPGPDDPVHGMTANAFVAVSLVPPLVLVSVARSATAERLITETGRYGVSVLGAGGEQLARHFAAGAHRPDLVRFVRRDGTYADVPPSLLQPVKPTGRPAARRMLRDVLHRIEARRGGPGRPPENHKQTYGR